MQIGKIGKYTVFWEPQGGYNNSGPVYVGDENCGEASTKEEAMQLAKRWVEQYGSK